VGIRKSMGSQRAQLIGQFYSESFLISMASLITALILVKLCLPSFNTIADKNISLPVSEPLFWLGCVTFTLITGLLAGSYPALYLSSFNAVKVLKGTFKVGRLASLPRQILVTFQFAVSVCFVIGTAVVYLQIQHGKNRPVGYLREGLLSLRPRSPEFNGKYDILRNELKNTGVVEEVAESDYAIVSTLGWNPVDWHGKNDQYKDITFNINTVTAEYGKTIGWEFVQGRDFSRDNISDEKSVVINESSLRIFNFEKPLEEILIRQEGGKPVEYKIVGIIKDVVKGSPFEKTDPCLYFPSGNSLNWLHIRLSGTDEVQNAIPKIESAFKKIVPSAPFDFTFADDDYNAKFQTEERIGNLALIFSSLAIFISCLGLFGLASFMAEQRSKEIGIRKVLGASVGNLWRMLSRDFVLLVVFACLIAAPLSYSFMSGWLQHYEYHIKIPSYVFILASGGAILITLLTVSYQSIKAALTNPVKSLRSE
jgi:putative ABC transport system permease protein